MYVDYLYVTRTVLVTINFKTINLHIIEIKVNSLVCENIQCDLFIHSIDLFGVFIHKINPVHNNSKNKYYFNQMLEQYYLLKVVAT